MSINKIYFSICIIFLISCQNDKKIKDSSCNDKIDSIMEIPKFKLVNIITQSDSIDIEKLKSLDLTNSHLQEIKFNLIKSKNINKIQEDFLTNYVGHYDAQNTKNQRLKSFTLKKDSIEMMINNRVELFKYNLYHSYSYRDEDYFKVKAGQYFLNFTPSNIVFVNDNLCMDCPEMVFIKK